MTSISPYNTHIATYEPIASQTLGSTATSVTFSSIPSTYTDLVICVTGRTDRTATAAEAIGLRFNSDTGSNYSVTYLLGSGSSASSARAANISYAELSRMNPSASGNTNPALAIFHIMSYSNTSVYKTALGLGAASAETYPVSRYVSLWRSTAAITSVLVIPAIGPNFVAGSTFSLYGIKGA
jgi:hypothetical protein